VIFLADESIEIQIVQGLRQEKFQVHSITETQPGLPDERVLQKAHAIKAVLLTQDKDFGTLIFQQKRLTHGVLLIRLPNFHVNIKTGYVIESIKSCLHEFQGAFSVLSENEIRIRKLQFF
jgi:predicted nuclease of predicted toxin-antitoxin system